MRMTKREYLESRPQRARGVTKREAAIRLFREVRRRMIASGELPDPSKAPPKYAYRWDAGPVGGTLRANTTGEARAHIKALLGLGSSRRLPDSVKLERLPNEDSSTCAEAAVSGPA